MDRTKRLSREVWLERKGASQVGSRRMLGAAYEADEACVIRGTVRQIQGGRFMIAPVDVAFAHNGGAIKGREQHCWIIDTEPFNNANIAVGDRITFSGIPYAYMRMDGSIDFSLKNCANISVKRARAERRAALRAA